MLLNISHHSIYSTVPLFIISIAIALYLRKQNRYNFVNKSINRKTSHNQTISTHPDIAFFTAVCYFGWYIQMHHFNFVGNRHSADWFNDFVGSIEGGWFQFPLLGGEDWHACGHGELPERVLGTAPAYLRLDVLWFYGVFCSDTVGCLLQKSGIWPPTASELLLIWGIVLWR